jgi:predicted RNase H-like HicB family nuclease
MTLKTSDIWGATENSAPLPEMDNVDTTGMTPKEAFEAGVKAGKLAIVRKIDEFFLRPENARMNADKITRMLGCTNQEMDWLCTDDVEKFDLDRLPQIYESLANNVRLMGMTL